MSTPSECPESSKEQTDDKLDWPKRERSPGETARIVALFKIEMAMQGLIGIMAVNIDGAIRELEQHKSYIAAQKDSLARLNNNLTRVIEDLKRAKQAITVTKKDEDLERAKMKEAEQAHKDAERTMEINMQRDKQADTILATHKLGLEILEWYRDKCRFDVDCISYVVPQEYVSSKVEEFDARRTNLRKLANRIEKNKELPGLRKLLY